MPELELALQQQSVVDWLCGGQDPSRWLTDNVPETAAPVSSGPVRYGVPRRSAVIEDALA